MPKSLYLYSPLPLRDLEEITELHQKTFDEMLADTFSDEELGRYEHKLDQMAAIYPQPLMVELTFDDLQADAKREDEQRKFFGRCQSSICLEELPYLENNPFQVTYLKELLQKMGPVLVDKGGFETLMLKEDFLTELESYKSIDLLLGQQDLPSPPSVSPSAPVEPIDFVVRDVYQELDRLKKSGKLMQALELLREESDKLKAIFFVVREERVDSSTLFRKTGLSPKDFDDYLEKLKFFLRNI